MTDTRETATADLTRLAREAAGRMRLPGPPIGKPLPSRIGSLASSVERFASSLSRPVEIRRSLRGPGSHEDSVRPPRWWTGETPASAARGHAAPAGRWLADATSVRPDELPRRSLPRAARAVPNETTYTPGGILTGLHAEVAGVRRLAEVAAAGPMVADAPRLGAATAARRRAEAARALPSSAPAVRPSSARPSSARTPSVTAAPPVPQPGRADAAPAAVVRRSTRTTRPRPTAPRSADRPAGSSDQARPAAQAEATPGSAPAPARPSSPAVSPAVPPAAENGAEPSTSTAPEVVRRSAAPASVPPADAPSGAGAPAPTATESAGAGSPSTRSADPGPTGIVTLAPPAESAGPVVRRRASFQLRPVASRLAASLGRGEPARSAAAPSRAASILRRGVGTGESIRAASGALLATPAIGHREAAAAAGAVRRLVQGRSDAHAHPGVAPTHRSAAVPDSRPAPATAQQAPVAPPTAGTPTSPRAEATPIRQSSVTGTPAQTPEVPTASASATVTPSPTPSEVAAPVVRRVPAGELSRSSGRWAAETLAGGSPSLAGLGVSMPDLMATRRHTDRSGDGSLASGFGATTEIRPATGGLVGSIGSPSSRIATMGGPSPTLRRSFRPRTTGAAGVPLLTPHLLAGPAPAADPTGSRPTTVAPPAGAPAGGATAPGAPARGAGHAPGDGHGHDAAGSPAVRRSALARRPAPGVPALPGRPAPSAAAAEMVRRTALRRFVDDGSHAETFRGIAHDDRSVLREQRRRLVEESPYLNGVPDDGAESPSAGLPGGAPPPVVRRWASSRRDERQRALEEQIEEREQTRGPNAGYQVQAGRAQANRARLKREKEERMARKKARGAGTKDLLSSTEHLFVEEDENGVKQPREKKPVGGSTTTGTSLTATSGESAKPERGRRRRLAGPELDRVADRVIERIEQRVIDELERRGRRDGRGGF